MKEKALTVPYKTSLDDVVKMLLEEKSKGEHAYVIFNGYIFYSDDITLDKAYKIVHGLSKEEYEETGKKYSEFHSESRIKK